jgi:tetratricopeptide (TPR) repeat protein
MFENLLHTSTLMQIRPSRWLRFLLFQTNKRLAKASKTVAYIRTIEVNMPNRSWMLISLVCGVFAAVSSAPLGVQAQELKMKITIPRHSTYTPVQRLNRDGVKAASKHDYSKAEELFYKAYLYDPDDPFTLNNLGYISELQGQLERAQRFYTLALEQSTAAKVDLASAESVRGETLKDAIIAKDASIQVNHANVEAVRLLSQGRALEADSILESALKTEPHNVFTLNNLGVAKEMQGEDEQALKYYDEAANEHSTATASVTLSRAMMGHPVAQIAHASAAALRARLARVNSVTEQAAELSLRGVSAVNRNDWRAAENDFRKAYALDSTSAFTLNNIAYVAELNGDSETANFFYERAKSAAGANRIVAVASRKSAEGMTLSTVATDSDSRVDARLARQQQTLRQQNQPVVLRRRDNSIVDETVPEIVPDRRGQKPQ